ncbi:hypothetical protein QVD17_09109 [Tagetes erecta]|uniref:Uncharacterized protein n=1 Tax=Tagetes erecta TaxID=13708 RepID=A0AAD8KYQ8_TARER|nr:hypothetical protein QVD17_09109 [Tagetes erecta]
MDIEIKRIEGVPYASVIAKSWHGPLDCSQEYLEVLEKNKSSKQNVVADLTTESESSAASDVAKEVVWMKKFITDLDVVPSIQKLIEIFYDNTGAISQAKDLRSHQNARPIHRKFHLIWEIMECVDIMISKVNTYKNLEEPFTKPITQDKHNEHRNAIGLSVANF